MVAIIDYDAGNLKSVEKAIQYIGGKAVVTREPAVIQNASHVILPGVGAFGDAMRKLSSYGLVEPVKKAALSGKPFLGICLGLQLLFERSDESDGIEGLSVLKGQILRIPPSPGLKIPHMGWNSLDIKKDARLFAGVDQGAFVYFVHSYYLKAENEQDVAAQTKYSTQIHASVEHGNLFACQFHPEKSGDVGLQILRNFINFRRI